MDVDLSPSSSFFSPPNSPPSKIDTVIGVVKAYTTRVGEGPFPTELECETGAHLAKVGHEFGTTTGRPRRCGWLDLPVVHYSHSINGYTSINITKLDVLSDLDEVKIGTHYTVDGEDLPVGMMPANLADLGRVQVKYETLPGWKCDISACRTFEELPANAQAYVNRIEELLQVPVSWVSSACVRRGRQAEKVTHIHTLSLTLTRPSYTRACV